jgi:hypothetical protein
MQTTWIRLAAGLCALALGTSTARADGGGALPRPDAHAPISVMGDHMHAKGEWMLSYRTMRMHMEGNRDGTHGVSDAEVLRDFLVAPTQMDMEMHMFGAMYAPADRATLMVMLPYVRKDMDHVTRTGYTFTTHAEGLGDVRGTALVRLFENEVHHLHANLGLSFPTGDIDERDQTPMGRMRLPYPMQLGSGTWDLLPGLTWTARWPHWSAGAQALGTIRLGHNSHHYRFGNEVQVQAWGARLLAPWLSASLRASYRAWGDVHGADPGLEPSMPVPAPVVPTADPNLRGGQSLELGGGLNVVLPFRPLRGHRLAVEVSGPVWQNLDGPQLESDWTVIAGWQLAF